MSLKYKFVRHVCADKRLRIERVIDESTGEFRLIKTVGAEFSATQIRNWLEKDYNYLRNLDIETIIKPCQLEQRGAKLLSILSDFAGQSLAQFIILKQVNVDEFLQIGIQLASTLAEIHHRGIIHQNFHPAAILIDPVSLKLKIIDFSLAIKTETQTKISLETALDLDPAYLAPEQTGRMNIPLDYRADFYSLGILLYQLIVGTLPFKTSSFLELIHCHLARTPIAPHQINSEIPEIISSIVLKLLAKNPDDRYQSAAAINADLQACQAQYRDRGRIEKFELGRLDRSSQFRIADRLYGRSAEFKAIADFLTSTENQEPELLLLTGDAGIGKTTLVNRVILTLVGQTGYCICGKFTSLSHERPYEAIVQGLQELIQQLLTETAESRERWRQKIMAAVTNNGKVIANILPELELIIGTQAEVPELPPIERQHRFNNVFLRFLRVFTQPESPLILFLDDLQRADSNSLTLIELLLKNSDLRYLRLVGAYRTPEVECNPALMQTMANIAGTPTVNSLELSALDLTETNCLLVDTFGCESRDSLPLAELLYKRTGGNPFFLHLLLQTFEREKLVSYNFVSSKWQWCIAEIKATPIANFNILELVCRNLDRLPPTCRQILKLAACFGNQFDSETLVDVWQAVTEHLDRDLIPWNSSTPPEVVRDKIGRELDYALKAGIIVFKDRESSTTYQFLDRRIYQTFYGYLAPEELIRLHLAIGKFLWQRTSPEAIEETIFELVWHLNLGRTLITERAIRDRLVELNLLAGQKAKTANAYEAASSYLDTAISLLPSSAWNDNYPLILAVYQAAAEVQSFQGNLIYAEQLGNIVISQAKTITDRIAIYKNRIRTHIAHNRMQLAIDLGLYVLKLLNVSLSDFERAREYTLRLDINDQNLESLKNLPVMEDDFQIQAIEIQTIIIPPIYIVQPELFPVVVSKAVDLCLKYGNCKFSAYVYALYALLLCSAENIDTGYSLGMLALELQEKFDAPEIRSKVGFLFNNMIRHWREPAVLTLDHFLTGIQDGVATGDIEHACFHATRYCAHLFFVGESLPAAEAKTAAQIKFIDGVRQDFQLNYAQMWHQLNLNLQGAAPDKLLLTGESFDETKFLDLWLETDNTMSLFSFYLIKLILSYLFQDYSQAVSYARQGKQYIESAVGLIDFGTYHFYYSLAMLAECSQNKHALSQHISEIKACQQKICYWADKAPDNYLHKRELVAAEIAKISGKYERAATHYDLAITKASKSEYFQELALAEELTAEFYRARGKTRIANYYLHDAYKSYLHWGALSKVRQLESQYPYLSKVVADSELTINSDLQQNIDLNDHQSCFNLANLDLFSIVKASQAISSEIILDNLLSKMMAIVMENAGAQKGVLLLLQNSHWVVAAAAAIDSEQRINLPHLPVSEYHDLPSSIVNYVQSTQKIVMLEQANKSGIFVSDAYIAQHQPKSILCCPMSYQNKLQGIIYLENSSIEGTFTAPKLTVLQALLSQVSISIANARLYKELEDHTSVQKSLRQKEILLKEIHHRVKNNLFVVSSLLDFQNSYVEDPHASKLLENCQNRITAMAMVHQHLYGNNGLDRIDFAQYLESLLDNLAYSQGSKERNINLILDLEPVELNIETANPCGLIVNELISNALEHGFSDRPSGNIWLKLKHNLDDRIALTVEDDGIGFKAGKNLQNSNSLGLELVCTLVEQIDGQIALDTSVGTKIEIVFNELDYHSRI